MRFLYIFLAYLLAPVFCAVLLWRDLRERRGWRNFGERFGFGAVSKDPCIWVHAASVGEVQAAAELVRSLLKRYPKIPVVVTTLTATGQERARALFGTRVQVRYIPLDLPGAVRRFFDRCKPRIAVIFETELWPNLYHECGRRRVPLVLASARLSPRSIGRYRYMAGLFKKVLSGDIVIAAQGGGDAERFRSIGANPARTHVTGNIKFDLTLAPDLVAHGRELRQLHGATRPVWIAGSTHEGEEQIALSAHRLIRQTYPDALLILVPRHSARFAAVANELAREKVRFVKRSQGMACDAATEVLLVDSLGELLDCYAAGDVAFVGGSLVPVGGHNLLEPAALGLPILTGPHNFNSTEIVHLLIERGAAQVVRDAGELAQKTSALFASPETRARIGALGRAVVESNRGALDNLLNLIEPLLNVQGAGVAAGAGVTGSSH